MSREEIIRMARESGMCVNLAEMGAASIVYTVGVDGLTMSQLERFASKVAEAERKECVKVCFDLPTAKEFNSLHYETGIYGSAAMDCAAAIKARFQL